MRHLLLGALILVGACGGSARAPAPKNVNAPPPAATDHAKLLADPLSFLPIDADIVFAVDLGKVRRSGLWRTHGPTILRSMTDLTEMKRDCQIDLARDVTSVRLAMMKVSTEETEAVIVVHGLKRDTVRACAAKHATDTKVEGELITGVADNDPYVMQFLDPTTMLIQVGPKTTKRSFQNILASGAPLRSSPTFAEMFGKIDQTQASWILVNGNAPALQGSGWNVKAMYGSVGLETGLSARGRVRFPDAAQATQITQMAQTQFASMRGMVTRLDLATDQTEMTVELEMTEAQVSSMIAMFAGMLGGSGAADPIPPFVPRSSP